MTSTREKLIEWLGDLNCNAEYCKDCEFSRDLDGCVRRQKEIIVDRLIANGVTFATDNNVGKWIPVTERLPEYRQIVAVCVHFPFDENARMAVAPYTPEMQPMFWERVTHWMPLPEPPKGE